MMRRSTSLILFIIAYLVSVLVFTPSTPVQADPATLSATPTSLAATVELGDTATLSLTITNTSSNSLTLLLYAGYPPTASPARMALPSLPVPLPQQAERIDPALQTELAHGPTRFLVFFADRPDLGAALLIRDWAARGEYVYHTLTEHAERSQRAVRAMLDAAGIRYTPLWIVNALLVEGDATLAQALADHADVAMLSADHELQVAPSALTTAVSCSPSANNVCWNIDRIRADRVWREFGVTGEGITVANIDSGVAYTHPALVGQYRGNLGGGVFDHNYNWFDPVGNTTAPTASGSHGTHVMGTMVSNPPDQPAMGVAPGARWIAARACDTLNCTDSNIIAAAQWVLAPTDLNGNNPQPSRRPHILNNSWAFSSGGNPIYTGYTAAWKAAGIFTTFAAGNTGNTTCSTIASPGDYADVVAVGAIKQDDRLAPFSAIGPTGDGRIKPDLVAPGVGIYSTDASTGYIALSGTSMAAPHVAGTVALLWSANPQLIGDYDGTYALLTNTAFPITGDTTFMGSTHSACRPIGVPNNIYGYGRLDAFAAVAAAKVDIPWLTLPPTPTATLTSSGNTTLSITLDARKVPGPGVYSARLLIYANNLTDPPLAVPITMTVPPRPTHATITGTVTDSETGRPLPATITTTDGVRLMTSPTGTYSLTVPGSSTQHVTAAAVGFVTQTQTITPSNGSTSTLNFALDPIRPRLTTLQDVIPATVDFQQTVTLNLSLRNDGNAPLAYTVQIDNEPYGVWRSDEPDGPSGGWIDPPTGRQVLNLDDDGNSDALDLGFDFPFGSTFYRQVYIGANGIIAFAPFTTSYFIPSCFPLSETTSAAISPLHVDFNSLDGGEISFAQVSSGALITWDDVPLYGTTRRLSVQALLQPNGVIRFHYRNVADLQPTDQATIGLQFDDQSQHVACDAGDELPLDLSDGLVIELRPQINPRAWLNIVSGDSGTLAASSQTDIPLTARWVGPMYTTSQARVQIRSNDPQKPVATVRVQLNEGTPAPYQVFIPFVFR
ncbi:S8 family serine peptidase [Chloroflexus aggregans]|uniref:Peptidase S8 and S53 subtilisin kexin sedolisin n=1 Tax=Chloroflexus aggregans (strain MD-66 / DSM 9485) TaxID=326427 RepID=B8GC02_CHLAD|nr:S8 family serine peptidase [Chloroflexus aggregans]ACL22976.1 peptidase S8 and S53 subtilisin kexin sedolisin [Chloroflexus aggregans DSM 9485]